jgi:glycosyltransferase involved in cell wall biosynthesis
MLLGVATLRRVGFDALFLDPGVSGGPESFARQLVPAIATARPDLELVVVTTRRGATALAQSGWGDFARVVALPMDDDERARKLVSQQLLLPRLVRRRRLDLVHSLSNLAPVVLGVPLVLSLHDVIFLRQPTMSLVSRTAIGAIVRLAAPRACAVVTLTEAAREEILQALALAPQRVSTVHPGPGRPAGPAVDAAELQARLGLEGCRVVLNVGAKRAHKNQALLVEALEHLPQDSIVVLAGHDDGAGDGLRALAAQRGVADRVVQLGYVDDDEIEALYALAACVALPTRAEGFGLPVLEAMRRGVPVACSRIPALLEAGGDAAAYFDPDDPVDAAAAIGGAMGSPALADRGRERAAGFTWEAAASAYLEIYDRCTSA